MEMTEKITTQRLTVPCYDTDVSHYLKPGAFMDMAQEIANVSADSLGFGFDALQRYGTAWVLSRFEAHFLAMPRWKDAVTLQTWHKGFEGPFYVNRKGIIVGWDQDREEQARKLVDREAARLRISFEEARRQLFIGRTVFPSVQPSVIRRYPLRYFMEVWSKTREPSSVFLQLVLSKRLSSTMKALTRSSSVSDST